MTTMIYIVNNIKKYQYNCNKCAHFAGAGAHLGLTMVINLDSDDYYCSSTNSIGLKVCKNLYMLTYLKKYV